MVHPNDRGLNSYLLIVERLSSSIPKSENRNMQMADSVYGASGDRAFGLAIDVSTIVTELATVKEARGLPPGAVVGDLHGGLTFTDAVAAALESRSTGGWREIQVPTGEIWTVIILNR
jgi:hypothetical protein